MPMLLASVDLTGDVINAMARGFAEYLVVVAVGAVSLTAIATWLLNRHWNRR